MQLTFTDNHKNFFLSQIFHPISHYGFFCVFFYQFPHNFMPTKTDLYSVSMYIHYQPYVALEFMYTCSIPLIGKTPVDTYAAIRFQTLIERKVSSPQLLTSLPS